MVEEYQSVLAKYPIIDTHAHYDDEKFKDFSKIHYDLLKKDGVAHIINNAVDLDDSAKTILELSDNYDLFYSAIGIHPETVNNGITLDENKLKDLSAHNRVVAIGEIGLDYYWSVDKKEEQRQVFCRQIEIANQLDLPVIVHDREAHNDTLEILKKYSPKGTVHCFSGSVEMAKEIINIGMYIGIGGVLTFKNARKICEVAEEIPLNRILLETDAPYLAPEPNRGKLNISSYIIYVAAKMAEIKSISIEEVLKTTSQNARKLYKL